MGFSSSNLRVEDLKSSRKSKSTTKRLPSAQHPVEIEYWYVLPTIRRELTKTLKSMGKLRQKEIAKILGITEAAVSQYIKGTRGVLELANGDVLELPEWLRNEINDSCETILKHKEKENVRKIFLTEVNRLIIEIRNRPKEFLCGLHEAFGLVDDNCVVCIDSQ
ncbi:MAG: transcriptional regulator [Candidatus Hodarchaeales archaeon]|jgi:predicted transcriptional regulator